jgi:hypothetical protein
LGIDPDIGKQAESKAPHTKEITIPPSRQPPTGSQSTNAAIGKHSISRAPQARDSAPHARGPAPECVAGPCCNKESQTFLPAGTLCAW